MKYLGIDVAKSKLDCLLLFDNQKRKITVDNNPEGFQSLLKCLNQLGSGPENTHICMESTGIYSENVAVFFFTSGFKTSVVNPLQIKSFRGSASIRTKNDIQDALCIAQFCKACQPDPWAPLPPAAETLRSLYRGLQKFIADRQRIKNRMEKEAIPGSALINANNALLSVYDQQIESIQAEIKKVVSEDLEIKESVELLKSIPGIGLTTAVPLLAEIGNITRFKTARHLVSFAGLSPSEFSSGSSVHKPTRLSKIGSRWLRKSLFLPAITAGNYNPPLKKFKEKLLDRGKSKMCVVGPIMPKLLHIPFAVIKSKSPFNPNFC